MTEEKKSYNVVVDIFSWIFATPIAFVICLPILLIESLVVKYYAKWFIVHYFENVGNSIINMKLFHMVAILGLVEWVVGGTKIISVLDENKKDKINLFIYRYIQSVKFSLMIFIYGYICHLIGGF